MLSGSELQAGSLFLRASEQGAACCQSQVLAVRGKVGSLWGCMIDADADRIREGGGPLEGWR